MAKGILLDRVGQELAQCYNENPLRIDNKKLSSLGFNTKFTITQIAWFFALTKAQIEAIDSIEWEALDLISCMRDLENAFGMLIEEFLKEQGSDTKGNVQWEETTITKTDNNLSIPNYMVSRPVFLRIFAIWISENGDIDISKINDMVCRQRASKGKARLLELHQRNLIDHLRNNIPFLCNNNLVRLALEKIPRIIWLKDIAHYLAITAKNYNDYGDVNYNSPSLTQNAKRIHDLLWQALRATLSIYWTSFSHMKPEHRKLAEQLGVIQIERYGNNPQRDYVDDWSVEITRELALQLLGRLSEFSDLLNCDDRKQTQSNAAKNLQISWRLPPPSRSGRDKTRNLKLALELLLSENPKIILMPTTLWHALTLLEKEKYEIYQIQNIEGPSGNKSIIFTCGHKFKYSGSAYPHIQEVIAWYREETDKLR